jgi:hypothetical protein
VLGVFKIAGISDRKPAAGHRFAVALRFPSRGLAHRTGWRAKRDMPAILPFLGSRVGAT